jgi:hypothetical protein
MGARRFAPISTMLTYKPQREVVPVGLEGKAQKTRQPHNINEPQVT